MKENEEREIDAAVADSACVGQIGRAWPKMEDKNEKEDEGVEEGDLERKKMFGKGVAARSLVRKLVKVEENKEGEVDGVRAVLPCVRTNWPGWSRSAPNQG